MTRRSLKRVEHAKLIDASKSFADVVARGAALSEAMISDTEDVVASLVEIKRFVDEDVDAVIRRFKLALKRARRAS